MLTDKSAAIKAGIRRGFIDGSSKLAQRRCYGYDNDADGRLVVNPAEAEVVRWIFNCYLAGARGHALVQLIRWLQQTLDEESSDVLIMLEWQYLACLDDLEDVQPQTIHRFLAANPQGFMQALSLAYKSKNEPKSEYSEKEKALARQAWRLLNGWKCVPGVNRDGAFDSDAFCDWVNQVKQLSMADGRYEVAMTILGQALVNAPADPDGFFMHRTIANLLQEKGSEHIRNGLHTAIYNSRGVCIVDSSGEAEYCLSREFAGKAKLAGHEGYPRLAIVYRQLADIYQREGDEEVEEGKRNCEENEEDNVD